MNARETLIAAVDALEQMGFVILSRSEVEEKDKEIAALREALRGMFCPRPCNHRPDDFEVGECFDAGECGCIAGTGLAYNAGGATMVSEKQIEAAADQISEGLGAFLRKFCDSEASKRARYYLHEMPKDEWNQMALMLATEALTAAEQAEPALATRSGGVKVKALEWEETHSRRSDEDPTTEWDGGFEADSALGYYKISMGFGSDAYYWAVTNPLGDDVGSNFEDPSYAKAAAQQDYERRILSALETAEPAPAAEPFARYARLIQIVEKLGGELNIEIDGKPEYVVTVRKVEADDERA